jgi:hypothetical protein
MTCPRSEVILTYGQSTSVEEFLKNAAKKRDFKVIVVESSPSLNGQQMAHSLASSGLDVTLIPDSAVFAMMARVNKVVVPAAAVVANGGLIAQSGLQNIALAAKKCSVPVVCVAGLIKLCPLYAHDLDILNELVAPSNIYNYEDTVENVSPTHAITVLNDGDMTDIRTLCDCVARGAQPRVRLRAARVRDGVHHQHGRPPAVVHLPPARRVLLAAGLPASVSIDLMANTTVCRLPSPAFLCVEELQKVHQRNHTGYCKWEDLLHEEV